MTRDDILVTIHSLVANVVDNPRTDIPLRDYGFDSLDVVELAINVETRLSISTGKQPCPNNTALTISTLADRMWAAYQTA